MQREIEYRGWKIRSHQTRAWFAHISSPESEKIGGEIPQATLAEGEPFVLMRARNRIDKEIAERAKRGDMGG